MKGVSTVGFSKQSLAISGLLLLTTACGKAKFDKVGVDSSLRSQSCPLVDVTVPVKMLFIVDTSNSNSTPTKNNGTVSCTGITTGCTPATDPSKVLRADAIADFLNQFSNKPNFSWSFATFGNGQARPWVVESQIPVFSTANSMQAAITAFTGAKDNGDTPYRKALALAKSTILQDSGLALTGTEAPVYQVVFFSDGYPTDGVVGGSAVDLAGIHKDVAELAAAAPGRIKLSTVYYGTLHDAGAASLLQNMADLGDGQFVDFDTATNATLKIEDLIHVQDANCGFKASN